MPRPFYKKVRAEYWEIFVRSTESNNILIKHSDLIDRVSELDTELAKHRRKAN